MEKIIPHLWFDKEAREAAEFYVAAFGGDSRIEQVHEIHDTPSGTVETVIWTLWGHTFMAISAGPLFKLNPSISFMLNFDPSQDPEAEAHLKALWEKLAEGGTALMPLGAYPFSTLYGWIQDKYGVSWQLILTNPDGELRPKIIPSMLFVGDMAGRAEEAVQLYTSIFPETQIGTIARYPAGMEPDKEGTIMFSDFTLCGQWFTAMDSAHKHPFAFNEAISFMVSCDTQEELDTYWEKLSAHPDAEQCGWLKDQFGVSWQIVPTALQRLMDGTEAGDRVMQAMLAMKKLDIAELTRAYEGN